MASEVASKKAGAGWRGAAARPSGGLAGRPAKSPETGPELSAGRERWAAIGVGLNALLVVALLAPLLGALADERRLTAPQMGLAATAELLAMAGATGLAGLLLAPRRLRLIGASSCLLLATLDLATMAAGGGALIALRAGAGMAEGVLLWITVGMIARTATPVRWAGAFYMALTSVQLALAFADASVIMPRFGASGGYAALALCALAGIGPALLLPGAYAPMPHEAASERRLPFRGLVALLAAFVFMSANGAVAIFLQRYALQAGLTAGVARTAVWVSLAAQVAGSAAATALAGRVGWFSVFAAGALLWLAAWTCFSLRVPAGVFIGANALSGLVALFVGPFFVPMLIEADPSRRAAMQTGAAQLLGGAAGPLMAFALVSQTDAHRVLVLSPALLAAGLAIMAWLRFTAAASGPTTSAPSEAVGSRP